MTDEEKQAIEHLTKKMKYHKDNPLGTYVWLTLDEHYVRIILKLVENLQKDIESWKKYCDEQENDITLKNNKICDLEFKIEKQSKEIEELKTINQMQKYRIEVIDERELISKDKIKEILGIEEDINNEKLLSLLQTIVDENSRLEDIEDRKVQIEYNNVFNKGVKSVEDKIKAKIEEIDIEIQQCEYADDDIEEYKKDIEKEKRRLLRDKAVLQSLLEKE